LAATRRKGAEQVHLAFLAAEPAAHAAHVHRHRVRGNAQHMGHHVLGLAGVLGGGMNQHLVVLAGNGKGDMPFEIHVVLPADPHPARDPVRGRGKCCRGVAALQGQRRGDMGIARRDGLFRRRDVRQGLVVDPCQFSRPAGLVAALGDHGKDRLAPEFHPIIGQKRLVVQAGGADVVDAGNVARGQHADHAGCLRDPGQVHRPDAPMRHGGQPQPGVQRARRFKDVVGIVGPPGDVLDGGVVREVAMHRALDRRRHVLHGFPLPSSRFQPRGHIRRAMFQPEPAKQVLRHTHPVIGACPHVGQRGEIARQFRSAAIRLASLHG
jgi:hypothetical protein